MSAPALPSEAGKAAWSANSAEFSPELRAVGEQLLALDQAHLFAAWPAPGTDDEAKRRFLTQVAAVEHAYLGGVATYVARAQALLKSASLGANPYEGFRVEAPGADVAVRVDTAADFDKYEPLGMAQAANTAFVIVAGGLGERLGYKGIKLALPSDICTEVSYIELYAKWILALQYRARIATNNPKLELQFAIMTSDDTDAMTRELLEKNANFGLTASQLTVFKQGKVPSLLDNAAHFVLDEKDPYALDTKPHGHGDVHSLLYGQGIVDRWVNVPAGAGNESRAPVKWIVFFQDTNGLVFHAIVPSLGVSAERSLHMNSITVPRAQGDAVGAICTLIRDKALEDKDLKDGDLPNKLTINVEYNQLEGLLGKGVKEHLQAGTNYSVYPGNINVLVMHAPDYLRVLHEKKGAIAEFVNPKYNADKQSFKKPTRLECMMQDYPKLLDKTALVGFTQFDRGCSFSAVKNALADGVDKQKSGNAPEVAATGEQDMYQYSYSLLQSVGAKIQAGPEESFRGIRVRFPPRVILAPSIGTTTSELRSKFPARDAIEISARSTLLLDGEDVQLSGGLALDGTLIIQAVAGAKVRVESLSVRNAGWTFRQLTPEEDAKVQQKYAIRGYVLERAEQAFFSFDKPGDYVLSDATKAQFEQKDYKHPARRSVQ